MYETQSILRSLLYQAKKAKSLKQAISAIEAMCQKDDIAAVDALLAKEAEARVKAKKQNN